MATLGVGAWLGEGSAPPRGGAARGPDPRTESANAGVSGDSARTGASSVNGLSVNLQKFKSRDPGAVLRDPFAIEALPGASSPGAPGAPTGPVVAPAAPPSAPALPFTYMGKLLADGKVAIFLTQGERNLVVHEGDTIDALYRVEHIAEGGITLIYLPLGQRQTLVIGGAQ